MSSDSEDSSAQARMRVQKCKTKWGILVGTCYFAPSSLRKINGMTSFPDGETKQRICFRYFSETRPRLWRYPIVDPKNDAAVAKFL